MSIAALMSDLMTVQTLKTQKQESGGFTNIWTDLATHVPCFIEDASAQRIEQFARMQLNVSHEIYTFQPDITVAMLLKDEADGTKYRVMSVIHERPRGNAPEFWDIVAQQQIETATPPYPSPVPGS